VISVGRRKALCGTLRTGSEEEDRQCGAAAFGSSSPDWPWPRSRWVVRRGRPRPGLQQHPL